ncbi:MAG: hypothetical protein K9K38_07065 [Rhodoferax sp.]|nr:hypothetical protein [Rhodoferax sp.]
MPQIDRNAMRVATVDHPYASGEMSQVTVGLSDDGVLLVKVSRRMRNELDDRFISLIGISASKVRFGVDASSIKGIVIELE